MITAFSAIKSKKFKRVAIFDWDLHCFCGYINVLEQSISEYGPDHVRCYGIHQQGLFPNITEFDRPVTNRKDVGIYMRALRDGSTSYDYHEAFMSLRAEMTQFQPDLILVSCGFDSCGSECQTLNNSVVSGLAVDPSTYAMMTIVTRHC